MGEEKVYQVAIATPGKKRYHLHVLPYLYENFSFERASEIDEKILALTATLDRNPRRGRCEDYLKSFKEDFRFLLFKETRNFELKIIYFIDEENHKVYVTDFFPVKMNPRKISDNY